MRSIVCLATLLCFFLCACTQTQSELKTFSYTEHCVEYADQNVNIRDPQGQKKRIIKNGDDAIAVAKEYCLINNVETMVAYDPLTGVYCVVFIPVFEIDGDIVYSADCKSVHVYVNEEGIALMTILFG